MNPTILVIDEFAVSLLNSSISPTEEWFDTFNTSDKDGRIKSAVSNNVAMIRSAVALPSSRFLVINLGSPSAFDRFQLGHKKEVLRRLLVAALCNFTSSVAIPRSWGCFNAGSRISFHALPLSAKRAYEGADTRVELDRNPFGKHHVYAYAFPLGRNELAASAPDKKAFEKGVKAFESFLAMPWGDIDVALHPGSAIQLTDESFFYQENSTGFVEWYKLRLTSRQRGFVDAPLTQPIRLRGAAGTGKTQALAVKVLMTGKSALERGEPVRLLFLTHSTATSAAVSSLLASLDNEGIIARLGRSEGSTIEITTLLELAMDAVGSDLERDRVLPLASDAREGRQLQLELIESLVYAYVASNDWKLLRGLVSPHFAGLMDSANGGAEFRRFAWELMNEFACVLDADGVQSKPTLRKQYLTGARQAWMMPLAKEADRKVVLEIYDRFNREIREMHAISVDQVISDYLNYLDSFRWNAVREKRGYDVVFVDELHLFNRQERMVLHGLTRLATQSPALFMAYDAKQAPADTFMPNEDRETSSAFWERLKVGQIQKVELDQVFRYTPEIAKLVASLDQSFPALDLGDEWGEYTISSRTQSAQVPTLTVLADEDETYARVMERARYLKRKGGQKLSVAVLCCNPDRFDTFRNAGTHKKHFVSISSREEAGITRPDAFRFVLSTPEYVAGLQFDCVILLDVSKSETPSGPYSSGARRKFISTVYLGASRAIRHLELFATAMEGGPASILDNALATGAVRLCEWDDLPSSGEIADGMTEVAANV